MAPMTLILNVLWVILGGGLIIFLQYALVGALLCLTVAGIPFGLQCFKIGMLGLLPFGKTIQSRGEPGPWSFLFNVVWLALAGIWIFLSHVGLAVALALTIIGIPFALQHLKLAVLALVPFGRDTARG